MASKRSKDAPIQIREIEQPGDVDHCANHIERESHSVLMFGNEDSWVIVYLCRECVLDLCAVCRDTIV